MTFTQIPRPQRRASHSSFIAALRLTLRRTVFLFRGLQGGNFGTVKSTGSSSESFFETRMKEASIGGLSGCVNPIRWCTRKAARRTVKRGVVAGGGGCESRRGRISMDEEKEETKFLDAVNLVSHECRRVLSFSSLVFATTTRGTLNDSNSIPNAGQPVNCLMFDAFEIPSGPMNV